MSPLYILTSAVLGLYAVFRTHNSVLRNRRSPVLILMPETLHNGLCCFIWHWGHSVLLCKYCFPYLGTFLHSIYCVSRFAGCKPVCGLNSVIRCSNIKLHSGQIIQKSSGSLRLSLLFISRFIFFKFFKFFYLQKFAKKDRAACQPPGLEECVMKINYHI